MLFKLIPAKHELIHQAKTNACDTKQHFPIVLLIICPLCMHTGRRRPSTHRRCVAASVYGAPEKVGRLVHHVEHNQVRAVLCRVRRHCQPAAVWAIATRRTANPTRPRCIVSVFPLFQYIVKPVNGIKSIFKKTLFFVQTRLYNQHNQTLNLH